MEGIKQEITSWLLAEKDDAYRDFSSSLLPNISNVLGVRLPKLRKFAKELSKKNFEEVLSMPATYMEETMLQGMLIGLIKESAEDKLERIKNFLPKINNWSICDSFCCGLKFTNSNKDLVWNFIIPLIKSKNEYEVRFALVMMLDYFVTEEYIDRVLAQILTVTHEGYYAKMAAAWALSICYIKFPKETLPYLKRISNYEIKQKAYRKICESYRVTKEDKISLKEKLSLTK